MQILKVFFIWRPDQRKQCKQLDEDKLNKSSRRQLKEASIPEFGQTDSGIKTLWMKSWMSTRDTAVNLGI